MATRELHVAIRSDGLEDLRKMERLLQRIEVRLAHLREQAEAAGVPLSVFIDMEKED